MEINQTAIMEKMLKDIIVEARVAADRAVEKMMERSIFTTVHKNVMESDPDGKFLRLDVCLNLPPKVISDGIWANPEYAAFPSQSALPMFELQILTIFVITQCFHLVLKRFGVPYFVSQIMAGFVLGPSIKGDNSWTQFRNFLFPYGSGDILTLISVYGYAFYLFLNSVQMDFSMITRTGRKAWAIALSSFGIPTAIGLYFVYRYKALWTTMVGPFDAKNLPVIVIGHTGCSFAVIASMLSDLEILNSELGRLALSAGLVMDVLSTLTTGVGTAIISSIVTDVDHDDGHGKGFDMAGMTAAKLISLIIFIPLLARPFMRKFVRNTPEGRPVKKGYTYIVILMAFFLGLLGAVFARQSVLAGVLLVGLAVPEGPPLGSELVKQFELFSTWFLLPLFVTCCAMKVDLFHKGDNMYLLLIMLTIIIVVYLLKMLITIAICRFCKMPKRDGLCLALMLSCKGVVDFCTNIFLFDAMLMSTQAIAISTIAVLMMGTMSRISVKFLYDPVRKYAGYQRRNILNLKPNSELKIVSCIHKSSHIVPTKNFLEVCCPTPSNPLVVHVLHLMELVGRSSPIFISHRLQERKNLGHKFSEEAIVTFDLFEHEYAGVASVSTYTAISPLRFMHDDICYLALDKLASIILLPFHVRWADDGSIESEDENIRNLNAKVLERAPCSVGILVNRGTSFNTNSKQIALIFLGGSDDREAVCLAKRTIKECTYDLVVYHLVSPGRDESANWDLMLDDEVLKGLKGIYGSVENVTYEKVIIENASEITPFLSEIATIHDFIIVGRRNGVKSSQTAALEDWTEYSELGVIGDLLASSDTNTKASILVVQQQVITKS